MRLTHKQLLPLYLTMTESLNAPDYRWLCRTLGFSPPPAAETSAGFRELILWANRHNHIARLVKLCQQIRPNLCWQNCQVVFPITETARRTNADQLITILTSHFSVNDLKQLCFYLGFSYGDIPDRCLTADREGQARYLRQFEFEPQSLSRQQTQAILKEFWADDFVRYWTLRNKLCQATAVCIHLHPEAF